MDEGGQKDGDEHKRRAAERHQHRQRDRDRAEHDAGARGQTQRSDRGTGETRPDKHAGPPRIGNEHATKRREREDDRQPTMRHEIAAVVQPRNLCEIMRRPEHDVGNQQQLERQHVGQRERAKQQREMNKIAGPKAHRHAQIVAPNKRKAREISLDAP